jgi:Domain of unknown function (DUF4331)
MSSHREAPEISQDPAADNTDVYAFVSPDKPDTVTLIANFIPGEVPDGAPNFYEFGNDVLYAIKIDNTGNGKPDVTYEFRFQTTIRDPESFLYNVGPIESLDSPNWNRPQTYSVTRKTHSGSHVLATDLACPPCNIGPRSTPNYAALAETAVHSLGNNSQVFAGQRNDPFFVDLGSIFDLGTLRPFENLHLIPTPAAPGVDGLGGLSVHSIALQVPKTDLTRGHHDPTDPAAAKSVIGVWATASRRKVKIRGKRHGEHMESGPWVQVSRLGMPLINEVIIAMGDKDEWNEETPDGDHEFAHYYETPELANLLPVLYPGVFPNLAALNASGKKRADLVAILLTGLPTGVIAGFQNFTGKTQADELRLNLAVPPTASPNANGILGGDLAGFPNGRRLSDDIVTIEIQAIAGATFGLVDPSFTADDAATQVTDGVNPDEHLLPHFPYVGVPISGYDYAPAGF